MPTNYYPILKTTIAEMRALKNISKKEWANITPILELTKSRKSKNNQECDVYKKIEEIIDTVRSDSLILDITSIESLSNEQIDSFQVEDNGFSNWCDFINEIKRSKKINITPVMLSYPDSDLGNLLQEIDSLCSSEGRVAIRIPILETGLEDLFDNIKMILISRTSLISHIIFDLEFVDEKVNDVSGIVHLINNFCGHVPDGFTGELVIASSSFPASALDRLEKNDDKYDNNFSLHTLKLYSDIIFHLKNKWKSFHFPFGDYACIHPFRNESKAYNWIPRIDYPTVDTIFFSRRKREDNGYIECAKNIVVLNEFRGDTLSCWGMDEIKNTSNGKPGGLSPSYWISVRSNIHMSRMSLINC